MEDIVKEMTEEENTQELPEVTEEPIEEVSKEKTKERKGVIVGCRHLNIRQSPNPKADVLKIMPAGARIKIKGSAGKGWFSIYTDEIPKGYAMVEYIEEK